MKSIQLPSWKTWVEWCHARKIKYPPVLPGQRSAEGRVNPYYFIETLTGLMEEHAIAIAGNGTACVALFQAGKVKKGQRMFWNSGCASMGYDLPAAIGACFAIGKKDVVCLAGDGSLQMNIQELQTVAHNRLPVKLFVLNNSGYISIRQTQEAFFEGRYVGCGSGQRRQFSGHNESCRCVRPSGIDDRWTSTHAGSHHVRAPHQGALCVRRAAFARLQIRTKTLVGTQTGRQNGFETAGRHVPIP